MLPPSADPKGDGEALAASLGNGDWQRQTIEEMRQEIRRIASEHEANWLRQLQQGQSLLTPSGFPSGNWFPSPSVLQPSNCTSAVDQWLETVKSAAVHSFAQVSGSEAPTAFGGANFGALSLQQLSSLQENPVGAAQQQHGFPTWQASLGLNVARNSLAPKQEYHEAKGKPIRQEHNLQVESEYDDEQYHSSEGDNNGSALERPARNTMDALSSLPPEKVKTLLSAGVRIKGRTSLVFVAARTRDLYSWWSL